MMSSEAARNEAVIDMAAYLRDTIAQIDATIADMHRRRTDMAVRLAVIDAATDKAVLAAGDDYERRVTEHRPYEDAVDIDRFIDEASPHYNEP